MQNMHSVLLKRCSQHQLSDTAARVRGTLSSLSVVVALVPIALGHFAPTTPPYSWPSALTVHLSTHWHFSDTRIRNGCLSLGRTETEPAFRSDFGRRAHTSHTRASDFGSAATSFLVMQAHSSHACSNDLRPCSHTLDTRGRFEDYSGRHPRGKV